MTNEDVMFKMNNRARKIKGMIYMDEMEDFWVDIGTDKIKMNCI